jgi:L-fucose mutarotase
MLKSIDPVLTGALLKALDEMGHGEKVCLVDRNYPAYAAGAPVIHLGEIGVVRAAQALFSVFPLDTFIDSPLARMQADDKAPATDTHEQVLAAAASGHPRALEFDIIARPDFYTAAKECSLIVQCLETAPYSCFIAQKGTV